MQLKAFITRLAKGKKEKNRVPMPVILALWTVKFVVTLDGLVL